MITTGRSPHTLTHAYAHSYADDSDHEGDDYIANDNHGDGCGIEFRSPRGGPQRAVCILQTGTTFKHNYNQQVVSDHAGGVSLSQLFLYDGFYVLRASLCDDFLRDRVRRGALLVGDNIFL